MILRGTFPSNDVATYDLWRPRFKSRARVFRFLLPVAVTRRARWAKTDNVLARKMLEEVGSSYGSPPKEGTANLKRSVQLPQRRLENFHGDILGLWVEKGRQAQAVPTVHLRCWNPGHQFFDHPDSVCLGETAFAFPCGEGLCGGQATFYSCGGDSCN